MNTENKDLQEQESAQPKRKKRNIVWIFDIVGTIVALTPVVTALATEMNCETAWLVAIVVGGAFFGDNLSFISDTTIAATQTQGCSMRSKFQTNIKLVTPAAVITLLLYAFSGNSIEQINTTAVTMNDILKCIPYLTVIICA